MDSGGRRYDRQLVARAAPSGSRSRNPRRIPGRCQSGYPTSWGFFQVAYIGKSFADPANFVEIPARAVLATGAGVDLFEGHLALSFRVDDLLDVRGFDLLGFPLPGRRYTGRLSYRYTW